MFIHADDPATLGAWYERHLGLTTEAHDNARFHVFAWRRDASPNDRLTTTWAIFPAEGPLPTPRSGVVNYHVDDLDRLIAQLQAEGIEIEKRQDESYGRFAWIRDPEGNKIELYQELIAQA